MITFDQIRHYIFLDNESITADQFPDEVGSWVAWSWQESPWNEAELSFEQAYLNAGCTDWLVQASNEEKVKFLAFCKDRLSNCWAEVLHKQGHSAAKAAEIALDAVRGNTRALEWLRIAIEGIK